MTEANAQPVLLTSDPAGDHSPAWSPDGRQIAFISNRTGDADVWLADLDKAADRFTNISHTPRAAEAHPTWRRDGSQLAWASRPQNPGQAGIYIWDTSRSIVDRDLARKRFLARMECGRRPHGLGAGDADPAADQRVHVLRDPLDAPGPTARRRARHGLAQRSRCQSPCRRPSSASAQEAVASVEPTKVAALPDVPSERWHIVPIEDVQLPSAGLHALVEPSFKQLRQRVILETRMGSAGKPREHVRAVHDPAGTRPGAGLALHRPRLRSEHADAERRMDVCAAGGHGRSDLLARFHSRAQPGWVAGDSAQGSPLGPEHALSTGSAGLRGGRQLWPGAFRILAGPDGPGAGIRLAAAAARFHPGARTIRVRASRSS